MLDAHPAGDPQADRRGWSARRSTASRRTTSRRPARPTPSARPRDARRRRARKTGAAAKRTARQARKVPGVAQAEGQIKGAVATEGDLAIARYDSLTADEITSRLPGLSQIDLAKIDSYERRGREPHHDPRPHHDAARRRAVARLRRADGRRGAARPLRAQRRRARPRGPRVRARAQEPRRRAQAPPSASTPRLSPDGPARGRDPARPRARICAGRRLTAAPFGYATDMPRIPLLALAAIVAACALPSSALAIQSVQKFSASASPSRAGTTAKPQAVSLKIRAYFDDIAPDLDRQVQFATVNANAYLSKNGITNNARFPSCSTTKIALDEKTCPSGSRVGTGTGRGIGLGLDEQVTVQIFNAANGKGVSMLIVGDSPADHSRGRRRQAHDAEGRREVPLQALVHDPAQPAVAGARHHRRRQGLPDDDSGAVPEEERQLREGALRRPQGPAHPLHRDHRLHRRRSRTASASPRTTIAGSAP